MVKLQNIRIKSLIDNNVVIGATRRNIPLVEARDENGAVVTASTGMVGAGTTPFYLVFGEDWFADGRHIAYDNYLPS